MDKIDEMIASWVRLARKEAGLSQERLGAELALELGDERGFTKANISHWETRKHSPNLKQLMAISKITKCSLPPDLIVAAGGTVESGPEHATGGAQGVRSAAQIRVGEALNTVAIRRINVSVRAGVLRLEQDYDVTNGPDLHIPVDVVDQHRLDPAHLVAMKVKGQSMEPMMFEDDLIVIDTSDKRPINRELYAINFDNEACIKQLVNRGGQWYLHSLNSDFKPVNIKSGDLNIIGRVVYQPGRVVTGRL